MDKFDIEVTLSSGRKGKGTTLFSVQAKTNDPCAVIGLDFPAFIYVQSTGLNRDIRVADSTATCHRLVVAGANSGASRSRFSYPVRGVGNLGRIVYMVGSAIVGVDFTVNGTAITVGDPYTIVPAGYGKDSYDLSPDGQSLYYSTYEGEIGASTGRLFRVAIPDQLNTTGTEIFSQAFWSIGRISVGHDETAVYSSQFYRENAIDPAQYRLARIHLGDPVTVDVIAQKTGTSGISHYDPAANHASSPSRFAYSERLVCEQIHVAHWNGGIVQDTTLQPYGRFPTWVGGMILAEGYKVGKRWTCEATDKIVEIDPNGGPAVELITGSTPDGR